MKKYRILSLLLALMLLVGLMAGCGSSSDDTETAEATEEAEEEVEEEEAAETEEEAETEEASEDEEEEAAEAETTAEEEETVETETTAEEEEAAEEEAEDEAEEEGFVPVSYDFPLVDETATLTFFTTLASGYSGFITNYSENLAVQELEELTNVHIEYSCYIPENAQTQFNLLAAAEDLPDLLLGATEYYVGGTDKAVEDEIILNLADYLDYCPNYSAILEIDDTMRNSLTSDTGNLVGFAGYADPDIAMSISGCLMIRGDWLEEVGMDVPTTYDEVHDVLVAFRDELGVETPMLISSYLDDQSGSFAAGYDIKAFFMTSPGIQVPFYVVDGEVKCAIVEDNFVEYLTMLRSYIEEGLVRQDIESYTNENSYKDLVTSGEVGFFWGFSVGDLDTLNEQVEEGGYFVAVPAIRQTADQTLHFTSDATYSARSTVNLSTNCSDIELACTWLDAHYTEEVSMLAMYGVEGVSYEFDANGDPQYTEMMTDSSNGSTLSINKAIYTLGPADTIYYGTYNTDLATYSESQLAALETINAISYDDEYVYPDGASLTTEEDETYSALISDLSTYMAEHVLKFVVGDESLDDYDDFVENLYDMGLQEAIDLKQAAYDRYISRG